MSEMLPSGMKVESKRRIEELYEALTMKHAMEYAKLLKEIGEIEDSEKKASMKKVKEMIKNGRRPLKKSCHFVKGIFQKTCVDVFGLLS